MLEKIKSLIPIYTLREALGMHQQKMLVGPMYLSNADYHAAPGLSKSALDLIQRSPLHYQHGLKNPDNLKEALIFGSAYHAQILKDVPLDSVVYITKTQPQKPELDSLGRMPLSEKNLELIMGMEKVFYKTEKAVNILKNAIIECSFFWIDPETGILCKCKPDAWCVAERMIWDPKTTTDIEEEKYLRTCVERRYEVQAAFCLDGVRLAFEQIGINTNDFHPVFFGNIAQEKSAPFDIGFPYFCPRTLESGEIRYKRNLATYAECLRTDLWPGKQSAIKEVSYKIYDLETTVV